jgi:hypothetical protein
MRFMQRLKLKLSKWLGVPTLLTEVITLRREVATLRRQVGDATLLAVDVGFKDPTVAIIVSRLNGGAVRMIPLDIKNVLELRDLVAELKRRYAPGRMEFDAPPGMAALTLRDFLG